MAPASSSSHSRVRSERDPGRDRVTEFKMIVILLKIATLRPAAYVNEFGGAKWSSNWILSAAPKLNC